MGSLTNGDTESKNYKIKFIHLGLWCNFKKLCKANVNTMATRAYLKG